MANFMDSVKLAKPNSNSFNLSHDMKFSTNFGWIVPIMCTEALPGDKYIIKPEALVRFMPTVAPVMHLFECCIDYFFVPWRILWPNFEKWVVREEIGGIVPPFPTLNVKADGSNYNRLLDYMGIPYPGDNVGAIYNTDVSAMPFAAYQKIYNEYFRDQNLSAEATWELLNGSNDVNFAQLTQIRNRAWKHDYFTSCLPFAQKGEAVNVPVGTVELVDPITGNPPILRNGAGAEAPNFDLETDANGMLQGDFGGIKEQLWFDPNDTLVVEAGTINDLRLAMAHQKWLEKNARGGTRYTEHIRAHFGVYSSDKRMQRPEYITGVKQPIRISEVLNTTGTAGAPQGTMAGHGVALVNGRQKGFFCEEHGYVMGVMTIRPRAAYQQGIPRHFLKRTADDLFYPDYAHIGEQEVDMKEIYAYTTDNPTPFGYLPRYAEYRTEFDRVAGQFRDELNFWHAGRIFPASPALNEQFVQIDPEEIDRIFAVTDPANDKLLVHCFNDVRAIRLIPKFGTPTF